ncbi:TPA: hypothetical protein SAY52_006710 [Burkholderia cenocepacia]|uniref:hypothetical protein n=1 Tax=unclassified Burkholderia TaxID=2613784 RepID=UPI00158E15F2|nr:MULTISPECIES: hypothetical protein [unclassified Burkholderia]HEF5872475.1 hypothetical protein [Burkholderia cenocepacia]HEF5875983.1 hypothetical protein [Burkholderia cenocepacia]
MEYIIARRDEASWAAQAGGADRDETYAGRPAAPLRTQQIESAEYHDTAEHDHRDGVLAEVENRGGEPRRDAEGADAGHRVFLECTMN